MPELPEVECLKQYLNRNIPAGKVVDVTTPHPRALRFDTSHKSEGWGKEFIGQHLRRFRRKGKFWVMEFSSDKAGCNVDGEILGHLGMTGRLYWAKGSLQKVSSKHIVTAFKFSTSLLIFTDVRKFGFLTHDMGFLDKLGLDPLDRNFFNEKLPEAFRKSHRLLKDLLMDQSLFCGIGNIYANEILFELGVHPGKRAVDLNDQQRNKIKDCIFKVIRRAVKIGNSLDLDFGNESHQGKLFYFGIKNNQSQQGIEIKEQQFEFNVYGRESKSCYICGKLIVKVKQSNRPTYFCTRCQV